ncbi:hypothetical protein KP509_14G081900 [Ceratopteris richardii]|uniref:MYB-CC type transcription factor LHEQLE-containing domain-containing protein n=1 Tax=Ceratopteris richardii TaxID=49495 RepID=A0A8T2TER9_CERRI|nr:hypothetical protein KP509_14G081900 [Ceratopteris richardii]
MTSIYDRTKFRLAKYVHASNEDSNRAENRQGLECGMVHEFGSITSSNVWMDPHLTGPLRAHMEMQRRLQDQLEIQRQLESRIEAQSRYLQIIIEEQERMGNEESKVLAAPASSQKQGYARDSKPHSSFEDRPTCTGSHFLYKELSHEVPHNPNAGSTVNLSPSVTDTNHVAVFTSNGANKEAAFKSPNFASYLSPQTIPSCTLMRESGDPCVACGLRDGEGVCKVINGSTNVQCVSHTSAHDNHQTMHQNLYSSVDPHSWHEATILSKSEMG